MEPAIVIQPKLPNDPRFPHVRESLGRVYGVLVVLAHLSALLGHPEDVDSLRDVLDSFVPLPGLAPSAMGLVPGWHDEAIWNPRSA